MSINKAKVKAFLKRFISGDMEVIDKPENGLCWNLKVFCTNSGASYISYYKFISEGCIGWGNITERNSFPIEYQNGVCLYEGSQLEQRISLVKHLLTKVDDYEG